MSETIACLSVRQPWASLIVAGIKPIENRKWYCAYRGPLLIHVGKTWALDEQLAQNSLLEIANAMGDQRRRDLLITARSLLGGLIGVCDMVGCVHEKEWLSLGWAAYDGYTNWFVGPYGFRLANARAFPSIIPYKGMQGLFRVQVKDVPFIF